MATELKPTTMRVLMILMRFANYSERGAASNFERNKNLYC